MPLACLKKTDNKGKGERGEQRSSSPFSLLSDYTKNTECLSDYTKNIECLSEHVKNIEYRSEIPSTHYKPTPLEEKMLKILFGMGLKRNVCTVL